VDTFTTHNGGGILTGESFGKTTGQTRKPGCFVAGTLVHTKDGLRPIEQIKVGDYVLSKPESGEGELSYQRVTRTYEYDDREVYFVAWQIFLENDLHRCSRGYLVVTGEHLFWVKRRISSLEGMDINNWMTVREMLQISRDNEQRGEWVRFTVQLADGREVHLSHFTEIMQGHDVNEGVAFEKAPYWPPSGPEVRFTEEGVVSVCNEFGRFVEKDMSVDDVQDLDVEDEGTFLAMTQGFPQMRRKVYNIEVENTHTYFVGAHGVWVHNTSGTLLNKLTFNPAVRAIAYADVVGGRLGKRSASVRRGKALSFSGCEPHPATIAPAGSNRSRRGGNKTAEASDVEGSVKGLGKQAGRNVSER
jgi:hypothetical protein